MEERMTKAAAKASVKEMEGFMNFVEEKDYDAVLEDWIVEDPSLGNAHAYGKIYGDKKGRFDDGTEVRTSTVVIWNKPEGRILTANSTYKLGKPKEESPNNDHR